MDLRVSIKKKLRDFTLDVDFEVQRGVFALLGESGSGKSITLKCIAGIETPDAGFISLNGRTLFDSRNNINLPPQARRAGYLFQNYALFPNMTVAQNITFAAVDKACLSEQITRFRLNGLEHAYPTQLSGGQQQRVALARVLASHAEILLLDEPFAALDSHLKWQLELELREVFKHYGLSILVSHDKGEAFRLADTVAVLHAGLVTALDDKHTVFQQPQSLSAALLTGCQNISAARKLSADTLRAETWQLTLNAPLVPDDLKFVGIRAGDLQLGGNHPCTVAQVIEDFDRFIILTDNQLRLESKMPVAVGSTVAVHFPPERIILLCH